MKDETYPLDEDEKSRKKVERLRKEEEKYEDLQKEDKKRIRLN